MPAFPYDDADEYRDDEWDDDDWDAYDDDLDADFDALIEEAMNERDD